MNTTASRADACTPTTAPTKPTEPHKLASATESRNVFHLVGWQGARKTTIALAMAEHFSRNGSVCMQRHAGHDGVNRYCPEAQDFVCTGGNSAEGADFLFHEHYPDSFAGGNPGDVVILCEVLKALPGGAI